MSDLEGGGLIPPPYLSPSSIETFRQCPLKYKLSRIDKLVDPPTEATIMGNFVHSVLEDLFALPPEERTLGACRPLMARQWNEQYVDRVSEILEFDAAAIRQFRWKSWWCVENYFKIEAPETINPGGIEHQLNGDIDGVPILGFIDRWSQEPDGICVSDYKTGKTPKKQYEDGKFFQLAIYALVLSKELEQPVSTLNLLYLKDGVLLRKPVTDDLLDHVTTVVKETYTGIQERCAAGAFEPVKNNLCNWCSYQSICPLWLKKR